MSGTNNECVVTTRMVATRIGFSRPEGFGLGPEKSWTSQATMRIHFVCFVSSGFTLQYVWCTSQALFCRLFESFSCYLGLFSSVLTLWAGRPGKIFLRLLGDFRPRGPWES